MTVPTIRCSVDAADPASRATELLVLGPSLGTTSELWQPAVASLLTSAAVGGVRILRFDLPGHGASPVATEPFSIAELADAVLGLVEEVGGGRFHYAGVSLSGAIGIELALRHPARLLSLGIFCSDARIGTEQTWRDRMEQVIGQSTAALVGATPARWFAPDFIEREPAEASTVLANLQQVDDASYVFCCGALAGFDRSSDVGDIAVPTIVASGEFDPVTPPADLQDLAARIPDARYVEIAGASHLAALERPAQAAAILADLVAAAASRAANTSIDDAYDRGMATRRSVLGDAHVDAAQAKITPETAAFQEFITRYAWGSIWTRTELSRRERSIATLASLVTGGHENEIAMHVRAALTNGLSRIEIAEIIMHTAIYAGVPAANSALAIARTVFEE